jgi:hypothetical protein
MLWTVGFKSPALLLSGTLLASVALSRMITRSTSSKRQQNSRVIAQISEELGEAAPMAWNVLPRESLPGPSKKPFRGLLGSPGAPLATPEVYVDGLERM